MNQALICFGSNIEKEENWQRCLALLQTHGDFQLRCVSPLYTTRAIGKKTGDAPDYLNVVFEITTALSHSDLTHALHDLEAQLGRVRNPNNRFENRSIDLDVVVFLSNDAFYTDEDIYTRDFIAHGILALSPKWLPDSLKAQIRRSLG